jgi:hypothetical protein
MKPKAWTLLVVSVLACGGAYGVWRGRQENHALETRLTTMGRGATRLVQENAELREAVHQISEEKAAVEGELASVKDALQHAPAAKDDHASTISRENIQRWLGEANDPTVMRRLNLEARYQTLRQYADLFDQLKLDPAVETRLTILLADKHQSAVDVIVTAFQRGEDLSQDPDRYREIVAVAKDGIEKEINALIGDEAYGRYQDYNSAVAQTNVLRNFDLSLRGSSETLMPEQAAQMRHLLQGDNGSRITPQMIEEAKVFLSPSQLQVLDDLRAVQQADELRRIQALRMELTPLPADSH